MNQWQERVLINPDVCHGKPCIKGTWIRVSVIFDNLTIGLTLEAIMSDHPPLTLKDIRSAIALCG